jgi:hypothetical protein
MAVRGNGMVIDVGMSFFDTGYSSLNYVIAESLNPMEYLDLERNSSGYSLYPISSPSPQAVKFTLQTAVFNFEI